MQLKRLPRTFTDQQPIQIFHGRTSNHYQYHLMSPDYCRTPEGEKYYRGYFDLLYKQWEFTLPTGQQFSSFN